MAQKITDDTIIGFIDPNPARRISAVAAIALLGFILLYIAAVQPPQIWGWMVFLVGLGGGCFYFAWVMWRATSVRLELTKTTLRDAKGRVLAEMDEIASVDRGILAFKPAGGFLIRLKAPTLRGGAYMPGLWWRRGRTIMVGGVTHAAQGKSVADLITVLLIERDGGAA
jgi:hypothetical protein